MTRSSKITPPTSELSPDTDSLISEKDIAPERRLIFALDLPDHDTALEMVHQLDDSVHFYKLGLQLFMSGNYNELAKKLVDMGKDVFIDLKFFDIPETIGAAVSGIKEFASFATVHGNEAMLKAACDARTGPVKILAVTVLTSLDQADINAMGFACDVPQLVLSRAQRALAVGCDGVISSGMEAPALRKELGDRFLIVAPGIRPVTNDVTDDQKRTVDVEKAFRNGADYIVVGRPIRDAENPRQAAEAVQATIRSVFS